MFQVYDEVYVTLCTDLALRHFMYRPRSPSPLTDVRLRGRGRAERQVSAQVPPAGVSPATLRAGVGLAHVDAHVWLEAAGPQKVFPTQVAAEGPHGALAAAGAVADALVHRQAFGGGEVLPAEWTAEDPRMGGILAFPLWWGGPMGPPHGGRGGGGGGGGGGVLALEGERRGANTVLCSSRLAGGEEAGGEASRSTQLDGFSSL